MSTQFTNRQWRLPNNENKDKQSNYSMDFDGSSQYIDLGSTTFIDTSSSFTISGWYKNDGLASNDFDNTFAFKTNLTASFVGYINNYTSGGGYDPFCFGLAGNSTFKMDGGTIPSGWFHLCLVYDGNGIANTTSYTLYINNQSQSLTTAGGMSGPNNINHIGEYNSGNYFDGQIDAVAIYNYALSSSQVTTLYGSSSTGIGNPMSLSPKPVAYYPLGDQDAFNGANYLVPNSSLKDYVFDFDGPSSTQQKITGPTISQGQNFTFSCWANFNNPTVNKYHPLLTVYYQNPANNVYTSVIELIKNRASSSDTNQIYFSVRNTSDIRVRPFSGFVPTANKWYNIVGTYDGNNVSLYFNGTLAQSLPQTGDTYNTGPLEIGSVNWFNTTYGDNFDGQISNVQYFNTALPATGSNSVETLYNNGSPLTSMSGFTSLQGWWKLDASATYDSSTTTWTIPDDSSNSNDGTSSGMTQANLVQSDLSFTSGYSPYALDFDAASSDYIDCGNVPELNGVTQISFSIWFNNQTPSNNKGLIGDMQAINFSPALGRFHLIVRNVSSNDYSFRLYIIGSDSAIHSIDIDNRPFTSNEWYNLVVVYNAGLVNFYVDGSLAPSTITAGAPIPTSFVALTYPPNKPLQIGRWSNLYFDGKISNASIWNTALTSTQVTEIYNEGVPSNLNNHSAYSNLVSWWQLGSNSSFNTNWTVLDEKGSNNGTSANMGEDAIVDGVNTYGGGTSSGMGGDEVIGDAPYSTANALSVNMDVEDRVTDTPS